MKQIIINNEQTIQDGLKELVEAKKNGEFAVFELNNGLVFTTDDIPKNYKEMDFQEIVDQITNAANNRKDDLEKEKVNNNELNNYENESLVDSTKDAIDGLAQVLGLSFIEKQQLMKSITEGYSDAEIIKQVNEKVKNLNEDQILDILSVIHDDRVKEFTNFENPKMPTEKELCRCVPLELTGFTNVKDYLLLAKDIFKVININVNEEKLKKAYEKRMVKFFIDNKMTPYFYESGKYIANGGLVGKLRDVKEFYPALNDELVEFISKNDYITSIAIMKNIKSNYQNNQQFEEMVMDNVIDLLPLYDNTEKQFSAEESFILTYTSILKLEYETQKNNKKVSDALINSFAYVSKYSNKLKELNSKMAPELLSFTRDYTKEFYTDKISPTNNNNLENESNKKRVEFIKKEEEKNKDKVLAIKEAGAQSLIKKINKFVDEVRNYGTRNFSNDYTLSDLEMVLIKSKNELENYVSVISEPKYDEIIIYINKALRRIEQINELEYKSSRIVY